MAEHASDHYLAEAAADDPGSVPKLLTWAARAFLGS